MARKKYSELPNDVQAKIKAFAKKMYFKLDVDGNYIYTYRDIADAIKKKYDVDIAHLSIYKWAKRFGWDELREKKIVEAEREAMDAVEPVVVDVVEKQREEIVEDEHYKQKIAQIKKAVYLHQAYAVKRAKEHLESLPVNSGKVPNAVRALTEANKALFDMLKDSPIGDNQKVKMNIEIIKADKVNVKADK